MLHPVGYSSEECDKVLEAITKGMSDPYSIYELTGIPIEKARGILQHLQILNPGAFYLINPQSPGGIIRAEKVANIEALKSFLVTGGFTAKEREEIRVAKEQEEEAKSAKRREELELENLELTIKRAKDAQSEARWALIIAGLSAVAAIVALFIKNDT